MLDLRRMKTRTKKVYVVAWEFDYGGGFDWYEEEAHAKEAFEEEKKNEHEFRSDRWKAFLVEYITEKEMPDEITAEIEELQPWLKGA